MIREFGYLQRENSGNMNVRKLHSILLTSQVPISTTGAEPLTSQSVTTSHVTTSYVNENDESSTADLKAVISNSFFE